MKTLNQKQQAVLKQALEKKHQLNPLRQSVLKSQLLERIADTKTVPASAPAFSAFSYKPVSIVFSLVIAMVLAGSAAFATESSIPGNVFHPIKLAAEKIELKLATKAETKATIEAKHASERINESIKLHQLAEVEQRSEIKAELAVREQSSIAEATVRAEHAVTALEEVRAELEAKGNLRAADSLDHAIERLQTRADQSQIKIEAKAWRERMKRKQDESRKIDDEQKDPTTIDDDTTKTVTPSITPSLEDPKNPEETSVEIKADGEVEIEIERPEDDFNATRRIRR